MSRQNEPIERDGSTHPERDVPPDPTPVPDGEPLPVSIEEPDDEEREPIDEHSDRHVRIVSKQELAQLRQCLRWG